MTYLSLAAGIPALATFLMA